ncbi:MAG: GGDEF domain-containing protein [Eubacteriales bacterium]|nr:GGDEF domain-containing protein [Eubacteriales bacterium]
MKKGHLQLIGIVSLAAALLMGLLLLLQSYVLSQVHIPNAALITTIRLLVAGMLAFFLIFGVLVLFIDSKHMKRSSRQDDRLHMAEQEYRLLESLCGCSVFRLELSTGAFTVSPNLEAALGRKFPTSAAPESIISGGFIYDEDLPALSGISADTLINIEPNAVLTREVRLVTADGLPIWYRLQIGSVTNQKKKPVMVLGTLTDIDETKQRQHSVIEKAKRDPMTGLYNKFAIQDLADDCLRESGPDMIHALFILDLDNFRTFNDTFGHLAGDQILCDLAQKLQRMFRQDDIIARIGGDEFAVLMKHAASHRTVRDKARQVSSVLETIHIADQTEGAISASIGVSLSPRDGETYISLLERADAALYYVKDNGKRHYKIYGEPSDERVSEGR